MTAKAPTIAQRKRWDALVQLGCCVGPSPFCHGRITIHHCFTGAGGRKNHDHTIPLCWEHHQGNEGIDGGRLGKRRWQERYGTEESLLAETNRKYLKLLAERF